MGPGRFAVEPPRERPDSPPKSYGVPRKGGAFIEWAHVVQRLGVITVVPLTSSVARVYPFQVLLPATRTGLNVDSKAQAEQVRSIAVERVGERLGLVPFALMAKLDDALRIHLELG